MYMDVILTENMQVFLFNEALKVVYVSPAALKEAGIDESQSNGMLASDLLTKLKFPEDEETIRYRISCTKSAKLFKMKNDAGKRCWKECRNSTITTPSGETIYQVIITDVSARYEADFVKEHDLLTGLYNHDYFVKKALDLDAAKEYPFTVLSADINDLKLINSSQGREMGDKVLCEVARIINEIMPVNGIAGRVNGDEFDILLPNTDRKAAGIFKEKLVKSVIQSCETGMVITLCAGYVTKTLNDNLDFVRFIEKLRQSLIKDKNNNSASNKSAAINYRLDLLSVPGQDEKRRAKQISDLSAAVARSLHCSDETTASVARVAFLIKMGRKKGALPRLESQTLNSTSGLPFYEEFTKRDLDITSAIDPSPSVAEAIVSYHENWDGSGIPLGVKGKKIPIISRIVRVSEAFATMIEDTPSSPHISTIEAIKNIKKQSGKIYDPLAVDVLAATLSLGKLEAVLDPWI